MSRVVYEDDDFMISRYCGSCGVQMVQISWRGDYLTMSLIEFNQMVAAVNFG